MTLPCAYCDSERPIGELERRHGKLVCIDVAACDGRDAARHVERLADLRQRRREGDELTEAEAQELADG